MKVDCLHGYFKFEETASGQLSRFMSLFGFEIERSGDHYTFADLVDAPDYSIVGGTFLNCPTTKNFEGKPWEVMRENGLVYSMQLGIVVPILTIISPISVARTGNYFVTTGMIQPGSVTEDGSRVTEYAAFFVQDRGNFKYSEISYE